MVVLGELVWHPIQSTVNDVVVIVTVKVHYWPLRANFLLFATATSASSLASRLALPTLYRCITVSTHSSANWSNVIAPGYTFFFLFLVIPCAIFLHISSATIDQEWFTHPFGMAICMSWRRSQGAYSIPLCRGVVVVAEATPLQIYGGTVLWPGCRLLR